MTEQPKKKLRHIAIDVDKIQYNEAGNPIIELDEIPPEKEKRRKPLPIEINQKEYVGLLEYTRSMHHKIAFMLGWESGLRISEVMHLQQRDIDVENDRMRINEGKGCKDRIVGLPRNWMPHHMKYIPFKCSARAVQKAFEMYATLSGLYKVKPKAHFHSLRHGYATHMIRRGSKISNVQMLLGHENIQTTAVYVNLTPEEALAEHKQNAGA